MICLEVLRERGLIELQGSPERFSITIRKAEHKVDLEASDILIRLRRQKADGTK
jgi:single-stranded-DNA-specific exonuclease